MLRIRTIAALAGLAFLGACASVTAPPEVDKLRVAEATGDAFTRALTQEYRELAIFEADEMYDWRDAKHHAEKGLRAANGEVVEPDTIESRHLPDDKVEVLTAARAELVGLLDANARVQHPAVAAHAQGRFDCWMEQQEENHQPDHIAACRDEFYAALNELKALMAPKPVAEPEPEPAPAMVAEPERFVIYFAFDSDVITAESEATIESALAAAKQMGSTEISVTGHADRAGPEEYNLGLSLRRANAVRDALAELGFMSDGISVAGRGEAEPAVATDDGVAEPANRRVEIIALP